jgi:hypothetical protein
VDLTGDAVVISDDESNGAHGQTWNPRQREVVDLTGDTIVISDDESNGADGERAAAAAEWLTLTTNGLNAGTAAALSTTATNRVDWDIITIRPSLMDFPSTAFWTQSVQISYMEYRSVSTITSFTVGSILL